MKLERLGVVIWWVTRLLALPALFANLVFAVNVQSAPGRVLHLLSALVAAGAIAVMLPEQD